MFCLLIKEAVGKIEELFEGRFLEQALREVLCENICLCIGLITFWTAPASFLTNQGYVWEIHLACQSMQDF